MKRLRSFLSRHLGIDAGLRKVTAQIRTTEAEQARQFERVQRRLKRLEHVASSHARQDDLTEIHEQLALLGRQMHALLRHDFLAEPPTDAARTAMQRRFAYWSQHDEDGIVYSLLQTVGIKTRHLVDIGCGDHGGNSSWLLQECGFRGLLLDASPRAVTLSRELFADARVLIQQVVVSARNVNALIAAHDFPQELDFLSIDVDGMDYWIWNAVDYRPRVVAIEYNSAFGPDVSVTVPEIEGFVRSTVGPARLYFGASLTALAKLGLRKGYRLIMTDASGTNAFFVRDDLATAFPDAPVSHHFRMYAKHQKLVGRVGDLAAHFRAEGLQLADVE